jgi:hypothetical protein
LEKVRDETPDVGSSSAEIVPPAPPLALPVAEPITRRISGLLGDPTAGPPTALGENKAE